VHQGRLVLHEGVGDGAGCRCWNIAGTAQGDWKPEPDLGLTARKMKSEEAERCGLVSSVFLTKEMMSAIMDIAGKSPVAVQGTKLNLVYSREHSVEEGLDEVAKWNMTMLQSEDLMKSAMAAMDKTNTEPPELADFYSDCWGWESYPESCTSKPGWHGQAPDQGGQQGLALEHGGTSAIQIKMTNLSPTMEEGTIVEWMKAEGESSRCLGEGQAERVFRLSPASILSQLCQRLEFPVNSPSPCTTNLLTCPDLIYPSF